MKKQAAIKGKAIREGEAIGRVLKIISLLQLSIWINLTAIY
jgi:hypothetical protein